MSVDGTWKIVVDSPAGRQEGVLALTTQGADLTGTCAYDDTVVDLFDGRVDGDAVRFKVRIRKPLPMKLTYTLIVSGDAMEGEVKPGVFSKQRVTGVRAA